jgi:hypothetical protein
VKHVRDRDLRDGGRAAVTTTAEGRPGGGPGGDLAGGEGPAWAAAIGRRADRMRNLARPSRVFRDGGGEA